MRTYKGMAELSFKVVVPDTFVEMFRKAAQEPDASQFHKLTHERHPVDDEAFAQAIISNALRRVMRNSLCDELHAVGLGGTVSPVTMEMVGMAQDHDAPIQPQVLHVTRPDGCVDVESSDDPGGALAYIASKQTPVSAVLEPLNKDTQ